MVRIVLFVEDFGHEEVLTSLVRRLAHELGVTVRVDPRSTTGGSRMTVELRQFLRELDACREALPDALIVARDANCKGFQARRKELARLVPDHLAPLVIYAIPDPHVERWLLLDSAAFKQAVGRGCAAPDQKCEKDRYKVLLRQAVREAGLSPLLGGLEHADSIVSSFDLAKLEAVDNAFGKLLQDLRRVLHL